MTVEEILKVVEEVVEILKPYYKAGEFKPKRGRNSSKYPEYYPGYNMLVKDYEDILVHAERGDFPSELFEEKSPNMNDAEYDYLMANFKKTTLPIFKDLESSIAKAFDD